MNIITIDSSDDECVAPSTARLVTPRELQTDGSTSCQSDDSSDDSIWDKGLHLHREKIIKQDEALAPKCDAVSKQDDESSVSSNDSFWQKFGNCSIGGSQKVHNKLLPVTGDNTAENDSVEEPSSKQTKKEYQNNNDSDDNSSVSSTDSILDRVFFQRKKYPNNSHDNCKSYHNNSSIDGRKKSSEATYPKQVINQSQDETSHLPSEVHSLISYQQRTDKQSNHDSDDNSSESSADSILNTTYFERKKYPINSYYDYCKYYPSKSAKDSCNKPSETTVNNKNVAPPEEKTTNLPPEIPIPPNTEWKIVLLMDHREFGTSNKGNNFLQSVEEKINKHFGGKHAEITTLPSADYLYVARLLSTHPSNRGKILDERVLDLLIERKAVADVCSCLVTDSKKYKPLSFFEAQMYKLMNCGMTNKIFVMEGDEDNTKSLMHGAKSLAEKERRLKRVKTLRLQLDNGEFSGVKLICTKNKHDTVKFLIHQLTCFQQSFDPTRPPTKTRELLKNYINRKMKSPTFLEYLRLRSIPSIGDVKAMKVIMDPNLDWDKKFQSPSSSKKSKATLDDKATFWKPPLSSSTHPKSTDDAKTDRDNTTSSDVATLKTKVSVSKKKTNSKKSDGNLGQSKKITTFFDKTGSKVRTVENKANDVAIEDRHAIVNLLVSDDEKENDGI